MSLDVRDNKDISNNSKTPNPIFIKILIFNKTPNHIFIKILIFNKTTNPICIKILIFNKMYPLYKIYKKKNHLFARTAEKP